MAASNKVSPTFQDICQAIKVKSEANPNSPLVQIAIHHLKKLLATDILQKRESSFSSKKEYQEYCIARLFFNKFGLLEFPKYDISEEIDDSEPSLLSFHITPDEQEHYRQNFLISITRGTVLHLRVLESSDSEYTLLVLNKYGSKERIIDYNVTAHMLKNEKHMEIGCLQPGDLVRAAAFGRIKDESGVNLKKFLVTITLDFLNPEYRHVTLGRVSKEEIAFLPESVSGFNTSLEYLQKKKGLPSEKELLKDLKGLGIDPYRVYSFHEPSDGLTGRRMKENEDVSKKIERSVEAFLKAEEHIKDYPTALGFLDESIKAKDDNDKAYSLRGEVYYAYSKENGSTSFLYKACVDFEKALELNPFNSVAREKYSKICVARTNNLQDVIDVTVANPSRSFIREIETSEKRVENLNKLMGLLCLLNDLNPAAMEAQGSAPGGKEHGESGPGPVVAVKQEKKI